MSDAEYLNTCRSQRNTVEYDPIDGATEDDAIELIDFSQKLKQDVIQYLTNKYPTLISK